MKIFKIMLKIQFFQFHILEDNLGEKFNKGKKMVVKSAKQTEVEAVFTNRIYATGQI